MGVTSVLDLGLSRESGDIVDHGWQVVDSNLVPAKVPELLRIGRHGDVFAGVGVASRIAHPNIVPSIGQDVGKRLSRPRHQPISRGAQETVLQIYRGTIRVPVGESVRDAVHGEDIPVGSVDFVALEGVAMLCDHIALVEEREWEERKC